MARRWCTATWIEWQSSPYYGTGSIHHTDLDTYIKYQDPCGVESSRITTAALTDAVDVAARKESVIDHRNPYPWVPVRRDFFLKEISAIERASPPIFLHERGTSSQEVPRGCYLAPKPASGTRPGRIPTFQCCHRSKFECRREGQTL